MSVQAAKGFPLGLGLVVEDKPTELSDSILMPQSSLLHYKHALRYFAAVEILHGGPHLHARVPFSCENGDPGVPKIKLNWGPRSPIWGSPCIFP